jgi:DNA-binding GntR family transcriptional regulator
MAVPNDRTLVPLVSTSVADAATNASRAAIVAHRYAPGAHLVERELAGALGVSSIAVREAFGRLEREGLVERIPRRGTFVTSMSAEAVRDLAANLRGRIAHFLREATASLARQGQLEWSAGIHQAWLDAVAAGDVNAAKHEARRQILLAADRIEDWLASQAPARQLTAR